MTIQRKPAILFCAALMCVLMCGARKTPMPDGDVQKYGHSAAQRFRNGEFQMALKLYNRARRVAAQKDIGQLEAQYLFNSGRVWYESIEFDSACRYFSASRRRFEEVGAKTDAAMAQLFEALCFAYTGSTDTAHALFAEASRQSAPGDSLTVLAAEVLLAVLCAQPQRAVSKSEQLIRQYGTGNPFGCGNVYSYKAMALFSEGDQSGALQMLDSSLACYRRSPWRYRNWRSLLGKAVVEFCRGDSAAGDRYLEQTVRSAPLGVTVPIRRLVVVCPTRWW